MSSRRSFLLKSFSLGLLATGCTPLSGGFGTAIAPGSVAVLGVVQRTGLNIPVNEYRLAGDLEDLLSENRNYSVMPIELVRQSLGAERHDLLLRRVAQSGSLDSADLRMLSRVNLPTRMGVLLTITGNEEIKHKAEHLEVHDGQGQLFKDREHLVLSTSRTVSLTATLVNLGLQRVRLHNEFSYESTERKRYLEYRGSTFSSSVAARLANTVANGVRKPDWPDAPNVYSSFYELLNDVADELPIA